MSDVGEKTSSPVSSATRAIHDAWEFLFPAAVQAALTAGIALFIAGPSGLQALRQRVATSLATVDVRGAAAALDQYKLTPLVPIAALFLLAALVYLFNRLVAVIGALVPFQMTWMPTRLLARMPEAGKLWARMPGIDDLGALDLAISHTLTKARAEGRGGLLSGVDHWERKFQNSFAYVNYAKFAVVWAAACALWARNGGAAGKAGLVWIACGGVMCAAFVRSAYATKQGMWLKIFVAEAILTAGGALQAANTEAGEKFRRDAAMDAEMGRGWWSVKFAPFDWGQWLGMVREFDVIDALPFNGPRLFLARRAVARKQSSRSE